MGRRVADGNHGGTLGYKPNSYGEWQEQPTFAELPFSLEGAADHWNHRVDDDYFSQPGKLFRLMSLEQQTVLFVPIRRAPSVAPHGMSRSATSATASRPIPPMVKGWPPHLASH